MSKELEALEKVRNCLYPWAFDNQKAFDIIETKLKDYEELEENLGFDPTIFKQDFETLMKEHKAFEIIKNKRVNLEYLKCCDTYEQYCLICSYANIVQEEFDLLKEVLS